FSKFLLKFKKDGKKIHHFLSDFFQYFFTIYIPKKRYCNDQEVLYTNDKVTFEPVYMKKGANVNETKNAYETDLQQSVTYRERRRLAYYRITPEVIPPSDSQKTEDSKASIRSMLEDISRYKDFHMEMYPRQMNLEKRFQ